MKTMMMTLTETKATALTLVEMRDSKIIDFLRK